MTRQPRPGESLRLAAIGDLLLTSRFGGTRPGRGMEALADPLRELLLSCDVVFANLECTLPGPASVPTEPRVVSTQRQIRTLSDAGVHVVTLGNNHTFDHLDEGFRRVRALLDDMGIRWCGAGANLEEAFRPAVIEMSGVRLAFLGAVDSSSGPYRFAGSTESGVAPLDAERVCRAIRDVRSRVDHVIVSPHWGDERFRIPSPRQIEQARAFVDAGASLVLGHHPHVLQGTEVHRGVPIAYSLGNFLADDVYWADGDYLTWDRFERTGCIVVAELEQRTVRNVRYLPTVDDGRTVRLDDSGWGECCLRRANRLLARGVTEKRYARERFRVRAVKPILAKLRWTQLKRIRPNHFRKAARLLLGGNKPKP